MKTSFLNNPLFLVGLCTVFVVLKSAKPYKTTWDYTVMGLGIALIIYHAFRYIKSQKS